MHDKRIEVRWRDVDNYGHVNNAVYLTYFEIGRVYAWLAAVGHADPTYIIAEARITYVSPAMLGEWLARTLRDDEAVWDYVVAHVSIDFRREITQDDDIVVASCRPEALGTSSVRTREDIHLAAGPLAAEAHAVLVARDRTTGRSRPITAKERAAFERDLTPAADESAV